VETLTKYLAVAGGGAFGAVLRYYLGGSALSRAAAPFPLATFVINVTGSFVIGFFLTLVNERVYVNPNVRLAVAVGFVGAYTTFSTFEYDTARLVESKDYLYAFLNVVLSFVVGFAAVWAGIVAARRVAWMPAVGRAVYERLNREADACDESRSVRARQKTDAGACAAVAEKDADEAHTGEEV
jgi:CrcB protein